MTDHYTPVSCSHKNCDGTVMPAYARYKNGVPYHGSCLYAHADCPADQLRDGSPFTTIVMPTGLMA